MDAPKTRAITAQYTSCPDSTGRRNTKFHSGSCSGSHSGSHSVVRLTTESLTLNPKLTWPVLVPLVQAHHRLAAADQVETVLRFLVVGMACEALQLGCRVVQAACGGRPGWGWAGVGDTSGRAR